MELTDLKYFLAVARLENINQAAETIPISPGSLSKAIARLESELDVSLFHRARQRIKLTSSGVELQKRAHEILNLVDDAKVAIGSRDNVLNVVIAGEELLLAEFAATVFDQFKDLNLNYQTQLIACSESEVLNQIKKGEAHIGLTTVNHKALKSKAIGKSLFKTVVGLKHPLAKRAKEVIPVAELLEYPFATPTASLLGNVNHNVSFDGWREDKFPRKIKYQTSSIHTLIRLVESGRAIAYLPDYLVSSLKLKVLSISGCPYKCQQSIYMSALDPKKYGWLNRVF